MSIENYIRKRITKIAKEFCSRQVDVMSGGEGIIYVDAKNRANQARRVLWEQLATDIEHRWGKSHGVYSFIASGFDVEPSTVRDAVLSIREGRPGNICHRGKVGDMCDPPYNVVRLAG